MKITQEPLPKSQLGIRVEIPAADVAKRHDMVFRRLMKTVRLPGFRQGKVPAHVLRQYVGDEAIRFAVVEELLETTMPQALKEIDVPTIGKPSLREEVETLVRKFQPQEPFVFQIAIDVWPEVTLGDYHNLSIRAAKYEFDPTDVEDILRAHQERRATLVPVERPAQVGDVAVIDMDGYRQTEAGRGEAIDIFEHRDMQVEVDPEDWEFYQEVVEALVGMQVGETKEVTLVTGDQGWEPDMLNQTFILEITLKELKERELPELDDLFAQAISDCETIAELRDFLRKRYEKEAAERTQESIEQGITDALLAITTTELPHTLVERHLNELFHDVLNSFVQRGIDPEEVEAWLTEERVQAMGKELLPAAERRVKRVLALKAVAEREHLTPDPEAIAQGIANARQTKTGADLSEAELTQVVQESLRLKMAMAWLQERAQITWVSPEELLRELEEEEQASESEPTPTASIEENTTPATEPLEAPVGSAAPESEPTPSAEVSTEENTTPATESLEAPEASAAPAEEPTPPVASEA